MKYLQKEELHLVAPKFRQMVIDMWNSNEKIPAGILYISDRNPTDNDTIRAKELAKILDWTNV